MTTEEKTHTRWTELVGASKIVTLPTLDDVPEPIRQFAEAALADGKVRELPVSTSEQADEFVSLLRLYAKEREGEPRMAVEIRSKTKSAVMFQVRPAAPRGRKPSENGSS